MRALPPHVFLGELRRELLALVFDVDATMRDVPPAVDPFDASDLRRLIRHRRAREHFFDEALFFDPAWDMLLDLAAAEREDRQVSVSSLCFATPVPQTTALRWVATLERSGLVEREADPDDKRRYFVSLTPAARASMSGWLNAVAVA